MAPKSCSGHDAVREVALAARAFACVDPASGIGGKTARLSSAWQLADDQDRYLAFLDAFGLREVASAVETFVVLILMVQAWRPFPFLDPDLPPNFSTALARPPRRRLP